LGNDFAISVIGAGRFGSFFGEELSRYYDVVFYDKNKPEHNNRTFRSIDECLKRDIIFLAIPVSELELFLNENSNRIAPESIVVDLCSVKLKPKELFEKYLAGRNEYILTHPLFGPDSAKFSLEGHKIVITESTISDYKLNQILEILKKPGLEIVELSSDEHDRLMAYNLSLMHHLGRTFDLLGVKEMKLKMRSLSDIARISEFVMNDSEQLFRDFYRFNPYSHQARHEFEEAFEEITRRI